MKKKEKYDLSIVFSLRRLMKHIRVNVPKINDASLKLITIENLTKLPFGFWMVDVVKKGDKLNVQDL